MATKVHPFHDSMFTIYSHDTLPNLRNKEASQVYNLLARRVDPRGDEVMELSISAKADGVEIASLYKIAAFVRKTLDDAPKLKEALEGKTFEQRVALHVNLTRIAAYVRDHNSHVQSSSLVGFLHVLLLVLSLGLFYYRDALLIDEIKSSLKQLGATVDAFDKPYLKYLSLASVMRMNPEDRAEIMKGVGLENQWKQFVAGSENGVDPCGSLIPYNRDRLELLFAPLSLEMLQPLSAAYMEDVASQVPRQDPDLAHTVLGLLRNEGRGPLVRLNAYAYHKNSVVETVALLAPYIDRLSSDEKKQVAEVALSYVPKVEFQQNESGILVGNFERYNKLRAQLTQALT